MEVIDIEPLKQFSRMALIEACKDDCKGKQMQRGTQQQKYLARIKEQH